MKKTIIGIGEALWDINRKSEDDIIKNVGGAPANFAYHVSQYGFDSVAISALGQDDLGNELAEVLASFGLKTIMPRVPFATGTVDVTYPDGKPHYEITQGVAWDNIPLTEEMLEAARTAVAVCFGSLAQRSEVSRGTIRSIIAAMPADSLKVFDINIRKPWFSADVIEESLGLANVLKISDEEFPDFAGLFDIENNRDDLEKKSVFMDLIKKYSLRYVVFTCGEKGSHIYSVDGQESHLPTPMVENAKTVGAGDSFTAAFVGSILSGRSLSEAHAEAVRRAADVCTREGAF